ncbi:MAG: Asp23/Gls24 family envelope stress response protein [Hydrogenibacillus schlegelii]|uniref:Asp23/Gls24 family envelope stress response protein n=1 Tax=Hydrogenibacillus schlegelii TaxID=1484 RepID=A0A947GB24_HYDSH|nr:Asp23/Gls24 family envelope stress response protein [Hydrogenibacillus schlegelii]
MWRLDTPDGVIRVAPEAIARLAGYAAGEVYGVVGFAPRGRIKDEVSERLGRRTYRRGIDVSVEDGGLRVTLYLVVRYGTKISEVAMNVQARIRHQLREALGVGEVRVDVFVEGVR